MSESFLQVCYHPINAQARGQAGRIRCYCGVLSFAASPYVDESLLVRAAVELAPLQHPTSLGGTLAICWGASGEAWDPDPLQREPLPAA